MNTIFSNNPPGATEILQQKCIAIAGCGGLGSNAAVALTRAGVGKLIIADFDVVETPNLNRQHYFQSDVGQKKVATAARHLKAINPDLDLTTHDLRLTPENMSPLLGPADLLIEAFDRADQKQWLIESWSALCPDKPIVCGNGLAGLGATNSLKVFQAANIYFCGDAATESSIGLCSARVAIVANMQANVAIELLVKGSAS